jgi:hypothetical protein
MKAYFALGGVHIDIDQRRFHFDPQPCRGVHAFHEATLKAIDQAPGHGRIFNGATVEKDALVFAAFAGVMSRQKKAFHSKTMSVVQWHLDEFLRTFDAEQVAESIAFSLDGGEFEHLMSIAPKAEANWGHGERVNADFMFHMSRFGGFRFEEFASGGNVVKELFHLDACTGSATGIAHIDDFSTVDLNFRAVDGAAFASDESEARDAGDAGHGFTPKSQSLDLMQVIAAAQLARGMSFQ